MRQPLARRLLTRLLSGTLLFAAACSAPGESPAGPSDDESADTSIWDTSRDADRQEVSRDTSPDAAPGDTLVEDTAGADADEWAEDAAEDVAPELEEEIEEEEDCVDDNEFFETVLYPRVLIPSCESCHSAIGRGAGTTFVLTQPEVPDFMERNREMLVAQAEVSISTQNRLLGKASGVLAHEGNTRLDVYSEQYLLLEEFVIRLSRPVYCPPEDEEPAPGLILDSDESALRRGMLTLALRLPTDEEVARLRSEGPESLRPILRAAVDEPAFIDVALRVFGDHILTDALLEPGRGIEAAELSGLPDPRWFDELGEPDRTIAEQKTNEAVAREPMEFLRYIIANDQSYRDLVAGNYTVMNYYLARAYGVIEQSYFMPELDRYIRTVSTSRVHSGILAMPAWLNRFPSTPTNKNRNRAAHVLDLFAATRVGSLSRARIGTEERVHNPTLNDPDCAVCHRVMDPVAGLYATWDDHGRHDPDVEWWADLATPGFDDQDLPLGYSSDPVKWLGMQLRDDRRLPIGITRLVFESLTGQTVLVPNYADTTPAGRQLLAQQRAQRLRLAACETALSDGGNLKDLFVAVVLTEDFRAVAAEPGATVPSDAGAARKLTPEELKARYVALLGYPWKSSVNAVDSWVQLNGFAYGGFDVNRDRTRNTGHDATSFSVGSRAAWEVACVAVPREFSFAPEGRRLLPWVELGDSPGGPSDANIRLTLRHLLQHLWGADNVSQEEVEAAFELLATAQAEGLLAIADGSASGVLQPQCQLVSDWWTGTPVPPDRQILRDDQFVLRAWMTVLVWALTDFHFLYQ